MDSLLAGLIGVAFGAGLNNLSARRGRKETRDEQREAERHARELEVAERLDEALVRASAKLDRGADQTLADRLAAARDEWQDAWVAYSPRVRQRELLERYSAVGNILTEYTLNEVSARGAQWIVRRAIANARATLAYFMRGDEELPATTFPEPAELTRLIVEGEGAKDPMGPLKLWLKGRELPEFHPRVDE
jgi:dsDNA-binding SOS-regulon protein